MEKNKKVIIGWIGVSITVILSSVWAYWGAFENFHEGWYATSIGDNLCMFLLQYMVFAIIFVLLALVILRWKRMGFLLHLIFGGFCIYFFSGASFNVLGLLIIIPFAVLGLLYYFGEPEPKKWAYRLIIIVPLVITLAISIPQGIKVSQRINDNDFGMRIVEGNGVTLAWAPRGPGWPDKGTSWKEAQDICKYLSEDGTTTMKEEQNIWRLPTVDEAVRSMMLHDENAGGVWYPEEEKDVYDRTPDKETPLWDVHSKVIYYWTSDTSVKDEQQAYIIVYHGGIFDKRKIDRQDYMSFRAVKEIN
ncbi:MULTISPECIES: DUF1566 domain-containing protein [Dehalobacter]|jgi:hypothetical protein|uniref:DUF1566 domain-containing protein n=2 Tax=Dehalobacter restrictus TaxID=55583 RepID=A0A857DJB4_9FIRM|nr:MULTISPECIES: DUF1566 domain-containing protein [Dehalobacter]AHF10096.1 hypothetical protein DEHRE_08405 [Dehalobacter restrictus DSM 9455]MCG1025311.1 DUF1566 domain-containing protein [Dehalobacter sp.]MDJ0306160.1 DUF1566 domain-containing protein [Dehalobacter sp.]OCZ52001.1 DUF1566 domain-containing protein [Dehalobacter sp. TeCB1]QHA00698.1 DUF1566 domain-containing protein [Dehalobacter restrictus]